MSFSSHPIKGTYYLHDLSLLMLTSITWLKWRLLAFSTVKLLLSFTPPFLYWLLWKEVTVQSLYFRGKELCSTSSRVKHLYCYLEFFCMENFVSSPSLVMESFIYISYGSWNLFYTWVIVQNYFIPFLKLFYLWPVECFQLVLVCMCVVLFNFLANYKILWPHLVYFLPQF